MKVNDLLENLDRQGVQLWTDSGKLRINAPKGVMTPTLQAELAQRKTEILAFLEKANGNTIDDSSTIGDRDLSLQTIGRVIGGFCNQSMTGFKSPIIEPKAMAKQLKVTFKPLPKGYKNAKILCFRELLESRLRNSGVEIVPWEQATKEMSYAMEIPFLKWQRTIKTRAIKANISAVIGVESQPDAIAKAKIFIAERLYQIYSRFILQDRKISVAKITQFLSWAEESIQPLEDPTNTQAIVLTELNKEFTNPNIPYQQKIPIGVGTLIGTFSEIAIGISDTHISILNMNLSDSTYAIAEMDRFVMHSLIPKIYVPILPLPMSRFTLGEYDPRQSDYAAKLVKLGREMQATGLLPAGFKIDNAIERKSHRDIVDWMTKGRTGVSYGFVAYAEPPHYVGAIEISEREWENLSPVEGISRDEVRQNEIGRRYLKTRIGKQYAFKQIPDIWLVSSRSGSEKTNLNLEGDILRVGLQEKLLLQLPKGIDAAAADIKPSYDIYVMVAMALSAALYVPELIKNGAPMVHFHGYPAKEWFESNEYYIGVENPSVPCGTYESGVFNFLGIHDLGDRYDDIALIGAIEPDHGTNLLASDGEYLVARVKAGIDRGQIELGGKHFASLKESLAAS
jgi:TubC N-terminal docking domain